MKPTRVTKVIVLVSVAVLAGTAGAASAGAPNGQTKEDLLKSVSLIHQLETAIRTKDDKGVTKASDSLEALWHRYRGTVPDWMRSSGAKISNGKYSVKNSAHQMARTSGGYTLENLDALSEAIARNVLVPIYPAVGQIEILYHDLFRLSGSVGKDLAGAPSIVKSVNADLAELSKVAPKSLTGKIATLKTDLGELATEVNKKEGSAVMKRLKSIDLTVRGMEEQVGVPKA